MRGNYFTGPVDLTNCRELLLLDLTVSPALQCYCSNSAA